MPYRATIFFKQRNAGWTETYWNLSTSPTQVRSRLDSLVILRAACLPNQSFIVASRVSLDDPTKDSDLRFYPGDGLQGSWPAAFPSDTASTCLTIGVRSSGNRRRKVSMRGIPDDVVTLGGTYTPDPVWAQFLAIYLQGLVNSVQGWAIRYLTNFAARIAITRMGSLVPGTCQLDFAANPNVVVNDPINIYGGGKAQAVKGTHRVLQVLTTADPWTIVINTPYNVNGYSAGAFGMKPIWALDQITAASADRISHRNAGRPFDLLRGRRSPVKQT